MALLNLDLFDTLAINQGYDWRATILYPGNILGSRLVGKIYSSYGGSEIETFRTEQTQFIQELNQTRLILFLNSGQTARMPQTGSRYWIYNVKLFLPSRSPVLLLSGRCKVIPSLPL